MMPGAVIVLLDYLAGLKRDETGAAYATGQMIHEATGLTVDEINDSVEILKNRDFVHIIYYQNLPYRFGQAKIKPEGRLFWEQTKFKTKAEA